jgi:hypothetical protein
MRTAMRLKHCLIVAGFAAAALFGGSPAWADDAIYPSAAPAPAECVVDPSSEPAPPAEESGAWAPGEEVPSGESGAGAEPCDDPAQPEDEPAPAPEEEREQEQREREREIEEAAAPVPMPADPNYTG